MTLKAFIHMVVEKDHTVNGAVSLYGIINRLGALSWWMTRPTPFNPTELCATVRARY